MHARIEGNNEAHSVETTEDILVLVFDSMVFALTIAKTWQLYRQWSAISSDWKTSLPAVLLHDGVLRDSSCISL